jgi:hypothetical protein
VSGVTWTLPVWASRQIEGVRVRRELAHRKRLSRIAGEVLQGAFDSLSGCPQ